MRMNYTWNVYKGTVMIHDSWLFLPIAQTCIYVRPRSQQVLFKDNNRVKTFTE